MNDFNFYGMGDFIKSYDFKDKTTNLQSYIIYMLNRVMQMFDYSNLPDTLPKKMIELYTMVNGHAVVVKHEGKLYVCFGGFAGEPNEYYIPKQYIVANPYLKLFKTFTIGEDCVLLRNDTMMYGLMPLFRRYASALVENDLTMNMVDINSRIVALIDAPDDATKVSAEKFLSDVEDGRNGIIASNAFFNGIRTQPYGEHNYQRLTDLIEYQQYMKASWFNELGLNANYNMKREAITSNESQLNDDMLLPLIDDMMECRKNSWEEVNDMFGTDISVSWGSTWEDNSEELELSQELLEAQISNLEGGDDDVEQQNDEHSSETDVSSDDNGERNND